MNDELTDEVDFQTSVADGKYTFISYKNGKAVALRYGEGWRDCLGDGFILALAQEITSLRAQLAESNKDAADISEQVIMLMDELEKSEEKLKAVGKLLFKTEESLSLKLQEIQKWQKRAEAAEVDCAKLLAALKLVPPMAQTLMDELGNRKATNWGIVNDALCTIKSLLSQPHPGADLLARVKLLEEALDNLEKYLNNHEGEDSNYFILWLTQLRAALDEKEEG